MESELPRATTRSFEEKYPTDRSDVAREVARDALGSDLPNGYTTPDQVGRITDLLGVCPESILLDVGAGRAWPGSRIAESTGCSLIATDLPMEALVVAHRTLASRELGSPTAVICADGRRLPLGEDSVDAICHADVLCWLTEKLSVLRECRRVLKPSGRLVAIVIETAPGLSAEQVAVASELGPSAVQAEASLEVMTEMSGLMVIHVEDVTPEFEATVSSILSTWQAAEVRLRDQDGDEEYEVELTKKRQMLEGIRCGLLRRTLVAAEKS